MHFGNNLTVEYQSSSNELEEIHKRYLDVPSSYRTATTMVIHHFFVELIFIPLYEYANKMCIYVLQKEKEMVQTRSNHLILKLLDIYGSFPRNSCLFKERSLKTKILYYSKLLSNTCSTALIYQQNTTLLRSIKYTRIYWNKCPFSF